MRRAGVLVCLLSAALSVAAQRSVPALFPDRTQGEIDGKRAVSFWVQGEERNEVADQTSYEVRLVPADDLDQELAYPAGHWIDPQPGRYRYWMEGNFQMSGGTSVLSWRGGPFKGFGHVNVQRLFPAGRVRLDSSVGTTPERALRLLHLDSHLTRYEHPQREMVRRLHGAAAHEGGLMPEGRVLAALFDSAKNEYLGVSRPVPVSAGSTTVVTPRPPDERHSHLVVLLERPRTIPRLDLYTLECWVEIAGQKHSPDVTVPTPSRLYAVWYDLPSSSATLNVDSSGVYAEPVRLQLRSGKAERAEVALQPRPSLEVSWNLPESLDADSVDVEVEAVLRESIVAESTQARTKEHHVFTQLPPEEVEVSLTAGLWTFQEHVDLRRGDQRVEFSPVPIAIFGSVFKGDETTPAAIRFEIGGGKTFEVQTDDDGEYQVTVFRPIRAATVSLRDRSGPPFIADFFDEPIETSRRQDFEIPDNSIRVRVVDERTGEGLPGATVNVENEVPGGRTYAQRAHTDEDGLALLPPLRVGRVEASARADGYLPSGEPVSLEILAEGAPGEITIQLAPEGEKDQLRLVLPDGRPAAQAEVRAHASGTGRGGSWWARADEGGHVEIPKAVAGQVLFVRHPAAAFLARAWPVGSPSETIWQLPTASGTLRVRTTDPWGNAIGGAGISLWIEGLRLEGTILAWLTRTTGGSNANGMWQAGTIPSTSVRLLASTPGQAPHPENLAQEVAPPWPPLVELVVVR